MLPSGFVGAPLSLRRLASTKSAFIPAGGWGRSKRTTFPIGGCVCVCSVWFGLVVMYARAASGSGRGEVHMHNSSRVSLCSHLMFS